MSDETAIDITSNGTIAKSTDKPTFSLKSLNLASKCPGIVVAPTGSKFSKYLFPKIKFEEGRRVRLAILSEDVIRVKLHYHPEVGNIICTDGACCKYCEKLSFKFCYPCVVYETDSAGRPVSTNVEMKLLVLGGELYDQISLLSEVTGQITSVDLLFSCTSTQYQKCQITQAGNALWVNNPDTVKYVTEYMNNNGDRLLDAVGKTYTAEQLSEKIGETNASVSEQKFISPDELSAVYNL